MVVSPVYGSTYPPLPSAVTQCSGGYYLTAISKTTYPQIVQGLSPSTELLHFQKEGEWYQARLACNGVPSIFFEIPAPTILDLIDSYREEDLGEYLERQAIAMIERYGDGRDPRPDPALIGESLI